jgi:predicted nucleotidyltransferase
MQSFTATDSVSASLFPKARREILGLLYAHPDRAFYLREIAVLAGLGVGHVQRELQRLTRGGILQQSKKGRYVYFQANESCPVYQELRGLVTKTVGASDILKRALAPLAPRIAVAFIYGSIARGEERSESDLDLMVIGQASFAEVVEAVRVAESRTSRAINPTVYPPEEFQAKFAHGHHFLHSVVKNKKLFVLGNENELCRLLEPRLDSKT